MFQKASRQYGAAAAAENQLERAEEFGRSMFARTYGNFSYQQ